MKVDLLELLRSKAIAHPTRMTSAVFSESRLIVSFTGHAWWRNERAFAEARYEFHFENVSDGFIDARLASQDWDEELECFSIQPLAGASWAQPSICAIYCSEALKDPLSLYAKLEKYLYESGALKEPKDFLNSGRDHMPPLAGFAQIASENSFFLASVPEEICTVLTAELSRQGVRHNIIRRADDRVDSRLHIQLGRSNFLCGSASAILPD